MTLESAIKHAEEVATKMECEAMCVEEAYQTARQADCEKCAEEHRQLAEWLTDYQRLLKAINDAKEEINYKSNHSDTGMSCGLLSALVIIDKYVYCVKPISTNGKESEC